MKIYKIRNKTTGLFSTGSAYPQFKKEGKVWKNKHALSMHFSLLRDNKTFYKNIDELEIVEYDVVESNTMTLEIYK